MQSEIEAKNRELTSTKRRRRRSRSERADAEPMNAGAKSSHAVVKAVKLDVTDQDVIVDSRDDGSVLVRISGGAAFNPGSATLTKRGKDALKKIADQLKAVARARSASRATPTRRR